MLSRKRAIGIVVLLFALSAIVFADQPYMRAARTNLQQAKAQLQAATTNKGGHRVKAIEHVNNAIGLVNSGIAFDRRHNHAQRVLGEAFNIATAPDQPHMRSALELLRSAKSNLDSATTDKGGYRVKAIEEINRAIDETQKGIDAGE
jgi:hypothetical protein